MGGRVMISQMRGAAMLARAVMAWWRYLRFLALSGEERQSRLKKRYSSLNIDVLGTMRRKGGYRLGEACHGQVHLWGRADQLQAGKVALVAYKKWQRWEACLPMEGYLVDSQETVGDTPAGPSPEEGHWVDYKRRGGQDS